MKSSPWRITIDTNPDQCNLKCTMCDTHSIYNKSQIKRKRMQPELLDEVLHKAIKAGVKEIIPSTMGEPLLYPYFNKFIEILRSTPTKLNLTTNGTFVKKGAKEWGKLLLPISSDTKISINGTSAATNEEVMIQADTKVMLSNIDAFLKVRDKVRLENQHHWPTVTLQVTFMRSNLAGITEVIEYAIAHKVDRVKGHHLWVTHPELEKENLFHPSNKGIWNDYIDKIKPYKEKIKLQNFTKIKEQSQVQEQYNCPFLGKELWIDCYGNYNVCCAPSNERKALGNFGNINNIPINDMFQTENYKELLKTYKEQPLCQKCSLRKADE